ncbi:hypothetical protein EVAR_97184_1 [Eumeta japonica]|uniref:Uncharacterized protein n=1 Tax=Eumeta variegata TaxID=151549 RepID=A0A4C1WJ78_EUMVA|nr:hypothetical protein EVAR_97184_1 [Eumeta japonica]
MFVSGGVGGRVGLFRGQTLDEVVYRTRLQFLFALINQSPIRIADVLRQNAFDRRRIDAEACPSNYTDDGARSVNSHLRFRRSHPWSIVCPRQSRLKQSSASSRCLDTSSEPRLDTRSSRRPSSHAPRDARSKNKRPGSIGRYANCLPITAHEMRPADGQTHRRTRRLNNRAPVTPFWARNTKNKYLREDPPRSARMDNFGDMWKPVPVRGSIEEDARDGIRNEGRQTKRWVDEVKGVAGPEWIPLAKNKKNKVVGRRGRCASKNMDACQRAVTAEMKGGGAPAPARFNVLASDNTVRDSVVKEIDASQAEHLDRSYLSIVPRSRSHARLKQNVTMSHAFSCVQRAFIDL